MALLSSELLVGGMPACELQMRILASQKLGFRCPGPRFSRFSRVARPAALPEREDSRQEIAPASSEPEPSVSEGFEQDRVYIVKLFGACFSVACVIKYGSLVFPGVTSPNIAVALAMILAPVGAALAILVLASSTNKA